MTQLHDQANSKMITVAGAACLLTGQQAIHDDQNAVALQLKKSHQHPFLKQNSMVPYGRQEMEKNREADAIKEDKSRYGCLHDDVGSAGRNSKQKRCIQEVTQEEPAPLVQQRQGPGGKKMRKLGVVSGNQLMVAAEQQPMVTPSSQNCVGPTRKEEEEMKEEAGQMHSAHFPEQMPEFPDVTNDKLGEIQFSWRDLPPLDPRVLSAMRGLGDVEDSELGEVRDDSIRERMTSCQKEALQQVVSAKNALEMDNAVREALWKLADSKWLLDWIKELNRTGPQPSAIQALLVQSNFSNPKAIDVVNLESLHENADMQEKLSQLQNRDRSSFARVVVCAAALNIIGGAPLTYRDNTVFTKAYRQWLVNLVQQVLDHLDQTVAKVFGGVAQCSFGFLDALEGLSESQMIAYMKDYVTNGNVTNGSDCVSHLKKHGFLITDVSSFGHSSAAVIRYDSNNESWMWDNFDYINYTPKNFNEDLSREGITSEAMAAMLRKHVFPILQDTQVRGYRYYNGQMAFGHEKQAASKLKRVGSINQKVGNCFYKNAMKMLLTVIANIVDKTSTGESIFKQLRNPNEFLRYPNRSEGVAKWVMERVRTLCFVELQARLGSDVVKSLFKASIRPRPHGRSGEEDSFAKYAKLAQGEEVHQTSLPREKR